MDWVAIGSVATVALVIVGSIQLLQASKRKSLAEQKYNKTPELVYRVYEGKGSYRFPDSWMDDEFRDKRLVQQKIKNDLSKVYFAHIIIDNKNKFPAFDVEFEIMASNFFSVDISYTTSLSKSAIKYHSENNNLFFNIKQIPEGERIVISLLCGSVIGSHLSSVNGSIKLKHAWIGDAQ